MLLILPVYFLIATAIAALALLPRVRKRSVGMLRAVLARLKTLRTGWLRYAIRVLHGVRTGGWTSLRGAMIHGARHRRTLAAALVAILLPSAIAMSFRHVRTFDYAETIREPDAITTAVLKGERLSPPPPLPPEAFTTREVELVSQRLDLPHASREWNMLDPDFRQRLLLVYKIMRDRYGYEMTLLEGYRSPARQARLAALGPTVTAAGAYQSYHQYGLAADSAFVRHGRLVITEKDPWAMRGYLLYGEIAESLGLTWGGGWKLKDYGHVELAVPGARPRRPSAPPLTTMSPPTHP